MAREQWGMLFGIRIRGAQLEGVERCICASCILPSFCTWPAPCDPVCSKGGWLHSSLCNFGVASDACLQPTCFMLQSMTPDERSKPELLAKSASRRRRIARGSGRTEAQVNDLLATFTQMRVQMKTMSKMMAQSGQMGGHLFLNVIVIIVVITYFSNSSACHVGCCLLVRLDAACLSGWSC